MKEVSIIVLTYNRFEYLEENLKSIFEQNYKNYEVIISDDCSPNFNKGQIKKILDQYKDMDINLFRNKKNLGTVKNFNQAIKNSKGNIIVPLSADDLFYDENSLYKIVEAFNDNKEIDIITGVREIYNQKKSKIKKYYPRNKDIDIFRKENLDIYNFLLKNGNIISGASTYYRKRIFEEIGLFNEKMILLEDFPYYLKVLRNNKKILFINKPIIKYRLGGVSTSFFKNKKIIKDLEEMAKIEMEFDWADKTALNILKYYQKKNIILFFKILCIRIFYKFLYRVGGYINDKSILLVCIFKLYNNFFI